MQPKVKILNVTKEFLTKTGTIKALSEINLDIQEGTVVAIIGPSGCGKSTLLNLIAGLERPSNGSILIDGKPIEGPGPDRGVCFQEGALFPWLTVLENVEFGPRALGVPKDIRREVAMRYVQMVGLTGFENKYPHELSGGMRQRCAVARVLANNPQIVLMDEALGAVDEQSRIILQEELTKLLRETDDDNRKTVIWVTHSIEEAVYMADVVVVMTARPGRIKKVVPIDLPRPRSYEVRRTPQYGELCTILWDALKAEAISSMYNPS